MIPVASVLIVDDESGVRGALADIFKGHGVHHVCAVSSAEEALRVLDTEPFNLIVCDYLLTGMHGVAFMGKLRLKGNLTPILFISGAPDKHEAVQAAAQLKAAFLAKPFGISQLMASVERLLT